MENPSRTYPNDGIAIGWYPERCLHTARCIAGLPDVFDPRRRPWIVPEGHTADEIAAVVQRCPTGALQYERLDGGPGEPVPVQTTILVAPDGPLFVRGDLVVEDADGNLIRRDTRLALCRCGGSAHKPFCDNTHRQNGFHDPARAFADGNTTLGRTP